MAVNQNLTEKSFSLISFLTKLQNLETTLSSFSDAITLKEWKNEHNNFHNFLRSVLACGRTLHNLLQLPCLAVRKVMESFKIDLFY